MATTISSLLTPAALLPFIYMFLVSLRPNIQNIYTYILLADGGWSFDFFNGVTFFSGIFTSLVMLATIKKIGKTFHYNMIMTTTQIVMAVALILQSSVLFAGKFGKWEYGIFLGFLVCLVNFSSNVLFVAVVGRMSKYLPEGFESFGVTTVVAVFNLAKYTLSQYFGFLFLGYYGVYDGYYSRMRTPQLLSCAVQIIFVALCPFFLFKK